MQHQPKRLFTMRGIIQGGLDVRAQVTGISSILAGFALLMGAPAWAADSNASPTVSLAQAVHFTDAKGQDLVVGPGEFRVEATGESGLMLTPANGKEPIVIEGQTGSVKTPAALSVPVNENEHHLVLLLPKGQFVEVVGSVSGVRPRGPFSSVLKSIGGATKSVVKGIAK